MQKICFNDRYGLTKAVLNGTKTMTRRLEKELDSLVSEYEMRYEEPIRIVEQKWDKGKNCLLLYAHSGIADTDREHVLTLNTQYKLNEVVAVAQSYETMANSGYLDQMVVPANNPVKFEFKKEYCNHGWSNKMFVRPNLMPHQIHITSVIIERLQDISDEESLKEGLLHSDKYAMPYGITDTKAPNGVFFYYDTPREGFADLMNRKGVGRPGFWKENPWVVVYEFKLIK